MLRRPFDRGNHKTVPVVPGFDWPLVRLTMLAGGSAVLAYLLDPQSGVVFMVLMGIGTAMLAWGRSCYWRESSHRHCAACGYDLTGLPAIPVTRCPECGKDYYSVGVQYHFVRRSARAACLVGVVLQFTPLIRLLVWLAAACSVR